MARTRWQFDELFVRFWRHFVHFISTGNNIQFEILLIKRQIILNLLLGNLK